MAHGRGHTDLIWRTPLNCNGGACVKVAANGPEVLIGDTKLLDGPVLSYTHDEWREFVLSVKHGDFDDLIR